MAEQRILVVDDNPDDLLLFREAFHLVAPGLEVTTANAIPEACRLLIQATKEGKPFSLLLIDAVWPGSSPNAILETIHDHAELHALHVAVMSSGIPPELEKEYLSLGVNHFVSKPVDWSAFTTFVRAITSGLTTTGKPSPWGAMSWNADPLGEQDQKAP